MQKIPRLPTAAGAAVAAMALLVAPAPVAAQQAMPAAYDTTFFTGLSWRNIGPNRGGRSIAVAGSASRPLEYYFGATGGGLWKTTDGGLTWKPTTDGKIGASSVGAVGICEKNPDVVYIGTGEADIRGNIIPGDGVYKSSDAGKTWTHVGFEKARNIAKVRVDPTNCDRVYVAAFGHYGEPNEERGVYRSTDGGKSWQKVLYRDAKTGAVELVMDPSDPSTLYAALWQADRKPWEMSSGGPGSGLFKTTDGGDHWTELSHNPGMPKGILGKIGISVSPVDANRVYAIVEADSGGVFRSDDAGKTWTRTNDERKLRQRAFYYTRIYADTKDKDRVYVLNVGFWRSDDGGKTFKKSIRVPHGDNHDLWIAPNDNQRMIEGDDGGATVSVNGGDTWTEQDFPTAQIYYVTLTHHQPYQVCGAQQDNSTVCVPYKGWGQLSATRNFYYAVGGGESGYIANDPQDPNVFYAGSYGGLLTRFDYSTGQEQAVNVWPDNPMGFASKDITERFQWSYPIVYSRTDPNTLYATSQHVWKSTDDGHSWEKISPDLTRHAPETMGSSGGPITKDNTGVETYATIFALAPSPRDGQVIWSGSDDGIVSVTRDGGKTWQNVTPPDLPDFSKITIMEASPHDPARAYFAANRFLLGDFTPLLYRTDDYGKTWTRITTGIAANDVAHSIREDVVRPGLLYAGTEGGIYISFDDGAHWQSLQRNLPYTQVADIAVAPHDLVIATHGRGFYVMPNIDVLRQLTPAVEAQATHLFAPAPAVRGVDRSVAIDYYLEKPAKKVTLEILDPNGKVVRTFTGTASDSAKKDDDRSSSFRRGQPEAPSVDAGLNRFNWDMHYPSYTTFPGMIMWAAWGGGPAAVPGRYTARLTVDGKTQSQPFDIELDPRLQGKVTQQDLQKQFDFAMEVRDTVSSANEAVLLIRGIKQQVDSLLAKTNDPQVTQAAKQLADQLSGVEGEIYQVKLRSSQDPLNYPIKLNNRIAALMSVVESAEAAPTEQDYAVFTELVRQYGVQAKQLAQILDTQLPALNQLLKQKHLPAITRTPLKAGDEGNADDEGLEEMEEGKALW